MTPDSASNPGAQSHDEKATCGITEGERRSETLYNAETSTRKWKREYRKRYKKQSHEGKASITEGEKQSETTLQNEQTSMEQTTPEKRFRKRYKKKKPKMNFIATKTEYYGSLHAHCHECKKQEPQPVMDGDILVQPSGSKRKLILRKGCLALGTPGGVDSEGRCFEVHGDHRHRRARSPEVGFHHFRNPSLPRIPTPSDW
ncbi:hypothetical protein DL95DRAFT_476297 [Leptodontidium sp. 2 PMI_412]|nr:hypothetical protein DL95DRAFT_476297 [Leptodontidium sp. 2 PMI_412]